MWLDNEQACVSAKIKVKLHAVCTKKEEKNDAQQKLTEGKGQIEKKK